MPIITDAQARTIATNFQSASLRLQRFANTGEVDQFVYLIEDAEDICQSLPIGRERRPMLALVRYLYGAWAQAGWGSREPIADWYLLPVDATEPTLSEV